MDIKDKRMNAVRRLVANRWKTPDGTTLWSTNRHDYVQYKDANGETYFVDGGNDYIRMSDNVVPMENKCIYDDDPWEVQRDFILRGTQGKNFDEKFHWLPISTMTDEHLNNAIEWDRQFGREPIELIREREYRIEKRITVDELR